MESSEGTSRRSERKRKRKESYSPEGKKEVGKKNKTDGQKSQNRSKLYSNRLYDVLPNGEPFLCHLCKSPYVVNPISKGVKKTGRSRHTPLPKVRTDRNTGREMMLCNACVQIFDRPQRRIVKTATVPSEEEKKEYLQEVDHFIKTLKTEFDDPLAEKLFCPVSQKKLCGCLQKYIQSTGNSHAPVFISLMKEAIELRKEKSYPITDDNKKVKLIGLGNGHKKSRRYEEFVLNQRRVLKEDMRLCERATQKILMYSNNFLHKRLKTENRPCRVERTRGKAALGQMTELHTMMDRHCCSDNCVMLALTHKRLLQDWRDRALQGQQEARRVMAEMLTPAGATHINCYSFISMVTGCSQTTIARVYNQMIDTGGIRDPPEHGMKRVWQEHYKQTKTSEGNKDTRSSTVSAESLAQEVTSSNRQTNQTTVLDEATLNTVRQHKLAWMQDMAKKQLQQQQLALHLQNIMMNKKKVNLSDQYQNSTVQSTQIQNKTDEISHNQLIKANNIALEQLQHIPLSAVFGLNPSQGHIITGQGHQHSSQDHMQQVLLQPPPQYGVNQSNIERQWNQSQLSFPVSVNQTNYLLTGDQQVLPVIPVFKHGPEGQMVSSQGLITETQDRSGSQTRPLQIPQHETVQTLELTDTQMNNLVTHQIASENTSNSGVKTINTSLPSQVQPQILRQYQIVNDQGVQLLNFQTPVIEPVSGEHVTSAEQSDNPERLLSSSNAQDQSENINPNVYFQIIPETTTKIKQFAAEKVASIDLSKPAVSVQSGDYDFIAQPLVAFEEITENKLSSNQEQYIDKTREGLSENTNGSSSKKLSVENTVADGSIEENSSTETLDSVANQTGQAFQQVNQTQLIVPVSFFPSSETNEVRNEQIPSQIQISFQTCSTESNQPSFTQQIILPHGNVVTLPLMPVNASKDVALTNSQLLCTNKDNNVIPESNNASNIVVQNSDITNLSRGNLQQHVLNQRPKVHAVDKVSRTDQNAVKSRNSSGNSKKSRNSSGSSDKSRKSVVHFLDTNKPESHQEHGHSSLRPEHLPDFHFVSKLNKSRNRQLSGNSEHGDRSRKSSGNSVISETSSLTSGLTLSNLASPNIFHDKEKGIFFIQSIDGLELNEIDSNQIVDFIQAVEADQTNTNEEKNTLENQRSDLEMQMFNQSEKLEAEHFNQSRNVNIGKTVRIKNTSGDKVHSKDFELHSHFDSQSIAVQKYENENSKHSEEMYIGNVSTHFQTPVKSHEKKKGKQMNKKSVADKKQSSNQGSRNKINKTDKFTSNMSNMSLPKDKSGQQGNVSSSKSFVPIAPKGSLRPWTVETSDQPESCNLLSHSTPVLSSLLARKPMFRLYE